MSESNTHSDKEGILNSFPKSGDLVVPEGYWKQFENNLELDIQELKDLQNFAPTLFSIPKSDLLIIPDGYFESLDREWHTEDMVPELVVPSDYFNQLSSEIMLKALEKEQTDLNVDEVFFHSMEAEILSKTIDKLGRQVVSFRKRRNLLLSTIGAAAALILAWMFFAPVETEECITFACLLEQSEISTSDLLEFEDMDLELLIPLEEEAVSDDDELYNYLLDSEVDLEDLYYEFE